MSEYLSSSDQPDDVFSQIIGDLGEKLGVTLQYNERGGYSEVSADADARRLRDAFEEHVKAAIECDPSSPLTDQDYQYITSIINRSDMGAMTELALGRTVSVGEGAFTTYPTERGTAYENLVEGERIVGIFSGFAIIPVPSIDTMLNEGREPIMNHEPCLYLEHLMLEDDLGSRPLEYDEMFVSIADPSARVTVRLDTTL